MFEDGRKENLGINIVVVPDAKEAEKDGNAILNPRRRPMIPYIFADGILAPRAMPDPDGCEQMGSVEYRALYYALCKFNQLNRTGVEWKAWGAGADEIMYSYPDTSPFCYLTLFVFLDVFNGVCGPTTRKIVKLQRQKPEDWSGLLANMERSAGGGEQPQHNRLSVKQFLECMTYWEKVIGVPRDVHAALADFVPGMCNIFRIRSCAVMKEYDERLAEFGGQGVGGGAPRVAADPRPEEPRGQPLPEAILFGGDLQHHPGMLKSVADLPRVAEKLEAAKRILGYDLLDLCANGPQEKLESLEYNSPAMYMAGWAAYEMFLAQDPERARRVRAVAGFEVGEYVALSVAGVLPFEAGLELAAARGKAMKELAAAGTWADQTSCSVAGLMEEKVRQLCEQAVKQVGAEKDCCMITSTLFNRGYVVGGRRKTVEVFRDLAVQEKALQAKILGLQANHSPLMHPVQWVIKSKLREFKHLVQAPWCDVYFNATSEYRLRAQDIAADALDEVRHATTRYLCETCWSPLNWAVQCQTMVDDGIETFIECGPTQQLKMLMKRINKTAHEKMKTNYMV